MNDMTLLLQATIRKEDNAREELFKHVYKELRRMAASRMASEAERQALALRFCPCVRPFGIQALP